MFITGGKVKILAGVYTISFLSVMALFAIGNILLKIWRAKLPRPEKAGWFGLFIGITGVAVALVGNITMKPENLDSPSNFGIFLDYFIPSIAFVFFMLKRVTILRIILYIIQYISNSIRKWVYKVDKIIFNLIHEINGQAFVFFTKGDNLSNLNKVILYILKNKQT